jgi:uncharacterized membrane protein YfcA
VFVARRRGAGAVLAGGGPVLVPLLSVGLVPLHNAIAASLLGAICVSTTASASFLRSGRRSAPA